MKLRPNFAFSIARNRLAVAFAGIVLGVAVLEARPASAVTPLPSYYDPINATSQFTTGSGWYDFNTTPLQLINVTAPNGHPSSQIIGFGVNGIYASIANSQGTFGGSYVPLSQYYVPQYGGWNSFDLYPRQVVVLNVSTNGTSSKVPYIFAFGGYNVYVSAGNLGSNPNNPDIIQFSTAPVLLPAFNAYGNYWEAFNNRPRFVVPIKSINSTALAANPNQQDAMIVGFGTYGVFTIRFDTWANKFVQPNSSSNNPVPALTPAAVLSQTGTPTGCNHSVNQVNAVPNILSTDYQNSNLNNLKGVFITNTPNCYGLASGTGLQTWNNQQITPRFVAYLKATDTAPSIIGFGPDSNGLYGVVVSKGKFDASGNLIFQSSMSAQTWGGLQYFITGASNTTWDTQGNTPRQLIDVNNDGKVDIVGFGKDFVYVAYGNGDGTFEAPQPITATQYYANNSHWSPDGTVLASRDQFGAFSQHPWMMGDANGDGLADLVGFAQTEVFSALQVAPIQFPVIGLWDQTFGLVLADGITPSPKVSLPNTTLSLAFSGYVDPTTVLAQQPKTPLAGDIYITLGGGSNQGKFTATNLNNIQSAINNGSFASYKGIAFDIELADSGLLCQFESVFVTAHNKHLRVLVTVAHSAPKVADVPDSAQLMKDILAGQTLSSSCGSTGQPVPVDILSPQLYSNGRETSNEYVLTFGGPSDISWSNYKNAKPAIIPSIALSSMYNASNPNNPTDYSTDAKDFFSLGPDPITQQPIGVTTQGFLQWH